MVLLAESPSAASRVGHIVELVEEIMQYASIEDTNSLQRVNKNLHGIISTSTFIQRSIEDKMYGPPIRTFNGLRIIQVLPDKIMRKGEGNSIVVKVFHETSPEKVAADTIVRSSKWRKVLVSTPPIQRMTGFGPCGGPAGILAASSEALTLGDLYDAAERAVFKHKTCSVCIGKGYFEVHFGHMYYRP